MPLSPPTPHADVASLLAHHGLAGVPHEPMRHSGFSGASLVRLRRDDGAAFVLKRSGIDRDWIMRATDDIGAREVAAAVYPAHGFRNPAVGVAQDGDGYALLMRDITGALLPQGQITPPQLDRVLKAMAEFHRDRWPEPWRYHCGVVRRLLLLSPAGAAVAASYGAPVAADLTRGWDLFARLASARSVELIHSLFADPSPLQRALEALPSSLLHGDLKFDNIGIDDGVVWAVDWAMTLVAPPAVELGWFLAINSRRLPVSLDDVMKCYAESAAVAGRNRARHDALTIVCGLLLRGWRKALDADEGQPEELRWWCERAEAALPLLER
jgi:hypothetical protein